MITLRCMVGFGYLARVIREGGTKAAAFGLLHLRTSIAPRQRLPPNPVEGLEQPPEGVVRRQLVAVNRSPLPPRAEFLAGLSGQGEGGARAAGGGGGLHGYKSPAARVIREGAYRLVEDTARGRPGTEEGVSRLRCTKSLERAPLPIKAEGVAAEGAVEAERADRTVGSRDAGKTHPTPPPRSEGG